MTADENGKVKTLLDRIVAMLTKLGQRGYSIHEEAMEYCSNKVDTDFDTDPDADGRKKINEANRSFHLTAKRRR